MENKNRLDWFLHDRFGMFIHWGIYAIPARGEWVRSNEKIPEEEYLPFFQEFNPTRFDPSLWARIANKAGQKYAVMTAKHHDGFCMFDSAYTDFKSTRTPSGKDFVREYLDAFRAEGLKTGLYYSLIDWHHPDYPVDRLHPMRGNAEYAKKPRDFSRYLEYMHAQVKELLSNYGKIDVIWFDFSYDEMSGDKWNAEELVKTVRSLQPDILIDDRLVAGIYSLKKDLIFGDFISPEQILPAETPVNSAGKPLPWEACITLNETWGYVNHADGYKSSSSVIRMLVECVSKDGNLLLNVGPDPLGRIPQKSIDILREVGTWMDHNGESIFGCGAAGLPKPDWGFYTRKGSTLYAHILDKSIGSVRLRNLAGKVSRARLLSDGSEVSITLPWNTLDSHDAFLTLSGHALPDPIDTVVKLELKRL
ncbi:MAG: alpha-L-fucosidase [Candidatus Ratteibacteria bacterium]|jgi:alpha-L-fucosidase